MQCCCYLVLGAGSMQLAPVTVPMHISIPRRQTPWVLPVGWICHCVESHNKDGVIELSFFRVRGCGWGPATLGHPEAAGIHLKGAFRRKIHADHDRLHLHCLHAQMMQDMEG